MQVKKTTKQFKRPRLTTERKRSGKKRAPSFSPIDICGTLARLQEKHTIVHKEQKEGKDLDFDGFAPALKLLKGILFKADTPYRTRLSYSATLATSAIGALVANFLVNSISSVNEWSSIDALFDQFFVHSMTLRFMPRNVMGAGWGSGAGANAVTTAPTGGTNAAIENASVIMASLFGTGGAYATAAAMANNPNMKIAGTGAPWRYVWRNNVKFEAHGLALGNLASAGWAGWLDTASSADLGGQIDLRAFNDVFLGTTGAILILGDVLVTYDVSFRARA